MQVFLYNLLIRNVILLFYHRYLLLEKKRGKALDSVANFHLQNGAVCIASINDIFFVISTLYTAICFDILDGFIINDKTLWIIILTLFLAAYKSGSFMLQSSVPFQITRNCNLNKLVRITYFFSIWDRWLKE